MSNLCIGGPEYDGACRKGVRDAGAVAVDIGSNTGGIAHNLCVMGYAQVHLFEPSPRMLEGSKTLLAPYLDRCVFNQKGVSDAPRTLRNVRLLQSWILCGDGESYRYGVSPGALALQPEPFDCDLVTLDDYCAGFDRLDLLKIDVEGYEWRVLRGGRATIDRLRPIIVLELSLYVNDVERCNAIPGYIDYLYRMDYDIVDLRGAPVPRQRMARHYPYHSSCDVVLYPRGR